MALVTLDQIREHALLQEAQDAQDDLLESLASRASVQVERYTQRQFTKQTNGGDKTYRYEGGGMLSLVPYDARTITTVKIDDVELGATRWQALPVGKPDGVFTDVELRGVSPTPKASGHDYDPSRVVTVTGTWGFDSVPDDVEEAVILTVLHLWRHFAAAYTASGIGSEQDVQTDGRRALPFAAVEMLRPYRRAVVV